ncbi:peptidylprolyl isomerase [Candidatus Cardinium hertigii]|uniref:peptidylprolyl isomerase n=1 Tax=Candidatus Cardinium hertigii TaxID=247481 RepID=UPI003D7DB027
MLFRLIKTVVCCLAISICAGLPITRATDKLLLDKVIASVNQEVILYSDLEEVYNQQFYSEVEIVGESKKIALLRELVVHKMLLAKAKLDDLKISKAYLEGQCEAKIASWIQHFGSEEKILEVTGKSIYHFKKKLKKQLKEQYLAMLAYRHLTQHVVVTPAEVKNYFNALPPGHLPYYPTSGEVYQLVVYPKAVKPTEQEVKLAEIELNKIRTQIVLGKLKFQAAVQQYAEDKKIVVQAELITHNQEGELLPGIRIPFKSLHPEVYLAIESLNVGGVSQPQKYIDTLGRSAWRLYYLKQKVEAHLMNLTQDYEQIHHHLLEQKKKAVLDKWMQKAKSEFVINFAPEYRAVEQLL